MSRSLAIVAVLFSIVMLPFASQIPSCMRSNAPKTGRIVDATTGKGIPDVAVIQATLLFSGSSFAAGNVLTRNIVYTDADGNYRLPFTLFQLPEDLPFRPPGGNTHSSFLITAFKNGYAFVGDDDAWKLYGSLGQGRFMPKSSVVRPNITWRLLGLGIEDIKLQPVNLTVRQAAYYYSKILLTGELPVYEEMRRPSEILLRAQANQIFQPQICGLDPETEIDAMETYALEAFVFDFNKFNAEMRRLEPLGFKNAERNQVSVFHAGNICSAMKASQQPNAKN